ncbi:hypothetical protein BXZ70DRAFT_561473 [Cristinia sonorae]|uniref:Uncharacterized protein n=1 Tax=Cristinia sonorae TaxID=1940300 RepID=A0A8K0UFJ6_9AGAR|nr:hypothetical protein BXZ70DRAFT_561473 [Cristinia sonorae]
MLDVMLHQSQRVQSKVSLGRELDDIFDISDKDGALSHDALVAMSRLIHIIHPAMYSLRNSHGISSSHFTWLTIFMGELCRDEQMELDVICNCISDIKHLLSQMIDVSSRADSTSFRSVLHAITQLRLQPGDFVHKEPLASSFVAMQVGILDLIRVLVDQGAFPITDIPTFSSEDSFHWDISQPQLSDAVSTLKRKTRMMVRDRDAQFLSIIESIAVANSGGAITPNGICASWLDDPRNDILVRSCIYAAHRWMVPHRSFSDGKAQIFSFLSLLDCERFRRPDLSHWGEDLALVQRTLIVTLWRAWCVRLSDSMKGMEVDYASDHSDLVENTLTALKVDTLHILDVKWYIQDLVVRLGQRHLLLGVSVGGSEVLLALDEVLCEISEFEM